MTPMKEPEALVWGHGPALFEIFLEPTCPFSGRAFGKLPALMQAAGEDRLTLRLWLHAQPWHMYSGVITRAILAAAAGPGGKEDARRLMAAVFARQPEFEFEDHARGPNMDRTPRQILQALEEISGLSLSAAFDARGLQKAIKGHTRYARQNGIHVSPTFMVNGLVQADLGSGDDIGRWLSALDLV
ncbi:DsbA family protein [Neotabrizicola sp. VNH66]|uniref:DsbA family protein n=1 Tax=Neotabrizicola sp. VNH66 TaxID=3400918 RepID=UPI003C07E40F